VGDASPSIGQDTIVGDRKRDSVNENATPPSRRCRTEGFYDRHQLKYHGRMFSFGERSSNGALTSLLGRKRSRLRIQRCFGFLLAATKPLAPRHSVAREGNVEECGSRRRPTSRWVSFTAGSPKTNRLRDDILSRLELVMGPFVPDRPPLELRVESVERLANVVANGSLTLSSRMNESRRGSSSRWRRTLPGRRLPA